MCILYHVSRRTGEIYEHPLAWNFRIEFGDDVENWFEEKINIIVVRIEREQEKLKELLPVAIVTAEESLVKTTFHIAQCTQTQVIIEKVRYRPGRRQRKRIAKEKQK